ncbi:M20/M25/M40 family metallo-hydrolase [Shewanella surugensis]|uniref:M20/M25/M40 family metallo-hydrolase n=1 Tax=Shewanella surugensis TaxID=212020 RepID=A0ABT0LDT1_9GAMM|nr:M20/M25/M40 family metallo-hydrolase [Shewanella surugensis]MCL1125810.1 M20/M25/M40 family metallo-hydrolase [Shewanella surugensis]
MKRVFTILLLGFSGSLLALNLHADELWITTDADALTVLKQVNATIQMPSSPDNLQHKMIAKISDKQVLTLSQLMHESHQRCGGFTVHDSEAEAYAASQLPVHSLAFNPPPINQAEKVHSALPLLSNASLLASISTLSAFDNRYYNSTQGVSAAQWVGDTWSQLSSNESWASMSYFPHASWSQDSVVLTLTGSEMPDDIIVIGGHLDSISNSGSGNNMQAPGADDNASGIATLTEVIRVFMTQGIQPKRTIKFMGYAAEEVGLRGSGEIASQASSDNDNVIAVMQLDMTGYIGSSEDIVFMDDYTDSGLNAYLMSLLDTYLPNVNYGSDSCGYGCSDHASWHNLGYPASMPFESRMNDYNNYIHTINDTEDKLDATGAHALNFAKLAIIFAIELGFNTEAGSDNSIPLENDVPVTNLSGAKDSEVNYVLSVPALANSVKISIAGGTGDADVYVKLGTRPTINDYDCRPYVGGNDESCNFTPDAAGDYYVMVRGYSSYSGMTLLGSYSEGNGGGDSGGWLDLSASTGEWLYYEITVPNGAQSLLVSTTGGSGDTDLYVRQVGQPDQSNYDCRPFKSGNEETCTINSPAAGTWYIGAHAYSSFATVDLSWKAQ